MKQFSVIIADKRRKEREREREGERRAGSSGMKEDRPFMVIPITRYTLIVRFARLARHESLMCVHEGKKRKHESGAHEFNEPSLSQPGRRPASLFGNVFYRIAKTVNFMRLKNIEMFS